MAVAAEFFETTPRNWRSRLATSVDVMRELSRYTDPNEMYHVFARRMSQLFPTSRQISLSRRGLSSPAVRVTRFNLWPDKPNPFKEPHRLPVLEGGLLSELIYGDQPRVLDNFTVDDDDPATEFLAGQRSLLAIPLFENGTTVNMVVLTREESAAFPREQVPELVWMSNLFGRATQTQVLSDKLREAYDEADYELRTVADLQHSLLPADVPSIAGLDVASHYCTANRAGGDYYDFFPLPNGKLGVLIADVSGHGTAAAMLMAITHALANSYARPPERPGEFLDHLNEHLTGRYTAATGHFVTAFYAVFDPSTDSLTYASAGHPPPQVAEGNGGWRSIPHRHALPLGVNARPAVYPELSLGFASGDRMALFTDGIIEATDRAGTTYGYERLDSSLSISPTRAQFILSDVLNDLDRFTIGSTVSDDRTLLIVCRT